MLKGIIYYDKNNKPIKMVELKLDHNTTNDNLKEENQILQGKILDFYYTWKDADDYDMGPRIMEAFKEHFNIKESTSGTT